MRAAADALERGGASEEHREQLRALIDDVELLEDEDL